MQDTIKKINFQSVPSRCKPFYQLIFPQYKSFSFVGVVMENLTEIRRFCFQICLPALIPD